MKIVRIQIDGTMNDIDIEVTKKNGIVKALENKIISKGTTDFKELYKWNYESKEYFCYGWYDGDSGFENKHELIPNGVSSFLEEDSSEKLIFGDIFIFSMSKKKMIDFCVSDYAQLYEIMFEGFDDCEEDEEEYSSEEEAPNTDDEGFIVDDDDDITDESYSENSEEELDEDKNEY